MSMLLTHFDPTKLFKLECDASPIGIGPVLSHRIIGTDYSTEFRFRALYKAERSHFKLEEKALALVFGTTCF